MYPYLSLLFHNLISLLSLTSTIYYILFQIPATPVEMPGSADISGLNLQFGLLQFGSEPVLQEYDIIPVTSSPGCQVQNCLYSSPSR
jgi:hypothetical protein